MTPLLHDSTAAVGDPALLYAATVAITALTAVLSRSPQRRRAAREVLVLLLRRPPTKP